MTESQDINLSDNSSVQNFTPAIFSTPLQEELITEVAEKQEEFQLDGKRIVDIAYFIEQLQLLYRHDDKFGCSISDMKVIAETRKGLNSAITFKCSMCHVKKVIWTNKIPKSSVSVNTDAVIGAIGIGIGFANMEEFFSTLNIPCMSANTYAAEHELVSNAWETCAAEEMKKGIEIEKELALERGDIDDEGVPLLTVIVDGTWSKRSYRTNYSSLSGAVSILFVNYISIYLMKIFKMNFVAHLTELCFIIMSIFILYTFW